jgi:hypothetical protein
MDFRSIIIILLFCIACLAILALCAVFLLWVWRRRDVAQLQGSIEKFEREIEKLELAKHKFATERDKPLEELDIDRLKGILTEAKTISRDFDGRVWRDVERLTLRRHELLFELQRDFSSKFKDRLFNNFEIAALDIFVEKAQAHLSHRAYAYTWSGGILCAVAAVLLILAITVVINWFVRPDDQIGWAAAMLYLFHNTTVGALFLAGVYLCVALARAFFHEATVLFNRIHAARFGRLYIYLKYNHGLVLDKTARLDQAHIDDIEKAFGWNIQMHTGFKDVSAEKMTTGTIARSFDLLEKVIEKIPKMKAEAKD